MIESIKRQFWPVALMLVFVLVPLQLATMQPRTVYINDDASRILAIVVLIVVLISGVSTLALIGLTFGTRARGANRPIHIRDLRLTVRLTAWGAGTALPVVAILLALANPLYAVIYAALVGFYLLYVVPTSRRRIGYRSTVTVRSTPEAAFALISDPHNWPRYLPDLEVVEPIDTPLHVGSVVSERVTSGGQVVDGQDTVTLLEPNRKLGMKGLNTPGSVDLYELKPLDGGTEISYSVEHLLGVPEAVIGAVLSRGAIVAKLRARREKALQRIKEILEAPPAATV